MKIQSPRPQYLSVALLLLFLVLAGCTPNDTNPSVPTAPDNLQASTQSSSTIALSWTAATTPANGGSVSGYSLERKTGSGTYAAVRALRFDATTFTDIGLTASTTYTYRLRAQNAFGFGPYSGEVSATTAAAAKASLPTR
ncbi:MAG: fibronectin type III domain-containing protein [Thermaceae bacterium]|nr:fibronectin type III domain-containing protein [Thermaceae bacterium]